jgi:hypothetical protein
VIERRGDGYMLNVDRGAVDAQRFEDVIAMARFDEDPNRTALSLREALALWRGHPYADIDAHGLLEPDVTRLTEMRIEARRRSPRRPPATSTRRTVRRGRWRTSGRSASSSNRSPTRSRAGSDRSPVSRDSDR